MKYVDGEGAFDLVIVNDDIEVACKTMRDFMLPFIKEVQEYQKADHWETFKFVLDLIPSPFQFLSVPNTLFMC